MWGALDIEQTADNKSTRKEKKMQKAALGKEEENTTFYLETTPRFWKTKTRNTATSEEQKWSCNNIPAAKADDCSLQGEWESNPQQTLGAKMRRLRGGQDSRKSQKKEEAAINEDQIYINPCSDYYWSTYRCQSAALLSLPNICVSTIENRVRQFQIYCLEFQQLRTNKYPKYTLCFVFVIG